MNKGEIAVLRVQLRAMEKGWTCSKTIEGARYDLILDDGNRLYRVQVKYCDRKSSRSTGAVSVNLTKITGGDKRGSVSRTYDKSEIDVVIVFLPKTNKLYWFDSAVFDGKSSFMLRYAPPKSNQKIRLRKAEDFEW